MVSASDHTFSMALVPFFLLLLLLPLSYVSSRAVPRTSQTGVVGVIYSMSTPGLPRPKQVADALVAAGVTRVLLIDTYPDGIAAFNYTGFRITIGVNNTYLPVLAANQTEAFRWIGKNIMGPNVTVDTISVGFDVLTAHLGLAHYLLPALNNLHTALAVIGMNDVTLSTSSGYELITPGFPPSAAHFNTSVAESHVEPLMEFLAETGSPFLIQLFPFKLQLSDAIPEASSSLATFENRDGTFLADPKTGVTYQNLFDAMVDATMSAMDKLGYADIQLVVAGTGWPSAGEREVPEASQLVSAEYNERLVNRLNLGRGTPARPKMTPPVTYIFSLFDGPRVAGVESAWNWGIWTEDMQEKYVIEFATLDDGGVPPRRRGRTLLSAAGWAASVAAFLFV